MCERENVVYKSYELSETRLALDVSPFPNIKRIKPVYFVLNARGQTLTSTQLFPLILDDYPMGQFRGTQSFSVFLCNVTGPLVLIRIIG